jgi:uncharacterized protein YndB with AHSA1/START domain
MSAVSPTISAAEASEYCPAHSDEGTTIGAELIEGYLLVADLSGYTRFVTGTELAHSHEIVRELTDLIRTNLSPPLDFVKVEGDAILAFGQSEFFGNAERVIELVEQCYLAFTDRIFAMVQGTTCECQACREIGTLGLKFVVHHGSFMVGEVGGRRDLSGPDVILVHRLLKNGIVASGGPEAYVLLSASCLDCLPERAPFAPHTETYEGFGEVAGGVHDLAAAAEAMRTARRERLDETTADVVSTVHLPAPPSVVWQYLIRPDRHRWIGIETGVTFNVNESGRMGPGASSHCAHGDRGDVVREYLDWQPQSYVTCRFLPEPGTSLMPPALETFELVPDGDGTRYRWYVRAADRSPEGVRAITAMAETMQALVSSAGPAFEAVLAEDGLVFAASSEEPRTR